MKKSPIRYKATKPLDITFHYTNPEMVRDLIRLIPFDLDDIVLDAGSGKNKVWYKNLPFQLPFHLTKYECEIEDGINFLTDWNEKVDWVIGNPPFSLGWKFFEKSLLISNKGIAFLGSIQFFNQFTPRRQQIIRDAGFYLEKIHIVSDKRWFGRYYFLIFTKKQNKFISWNTKTY
jgi:hypothetical protein